MHRYGDAEVRTSGCWSLWKNIAAQDPAFGHPEKFCSDIAEDKLGICDCHNLE